MGTNNSGLYKMTILTGSKNSYVLKEEQGWIPSRGCILYEKPENPKHGNGTIKFGDGETKYSDLPYFLNVEKSVKRAVLASKLFSFLLGSICVGVTIVSLILCVYMYGYTLGNKSQFEISIGYYDEATNTYTSSFIDNKTDQEYIIIKDGITGDIDVVPRYNYNDYEVPNE